MSKCNLCNEEAKTGRYCSKCRQTWKSPKDRYYHLQKHQTVEYKQMAVKRAQKWNSENYVELRKKRKEHAVNLKYNTLLFYSNTPYPACVKCGELNFDVLALDHINNNGSIERKNIGLKTYSYGRAWKIKDKTQYQTLCYNCNWKKHLQNLASKEHGPKYQYQHELNLKIRKRVIKRFSNKTSKCAMCGCSDIDVLCIDHVNNDGNKHRKRINGGNKGSIYRYLLTAYFIKKSKLQVLCVNCNVSKQRQLSN